VTECDPTMALANDLKRRRISRGSEIEPRRGSNVGMTPSVKDDARDVAPGIKSCIAQHGLQLLAYLQLKIRVRGAEQPGTRGAGLRTDRNPGLGKPSARSVAALIAAPLNWNVPSKIACP